MARKGPVVFDDEPVKSETKSQSRAGKKIEPLGEQQSPIDVDAAPMIDAGHATPAAMEAVTVRAARKPSWLGRMFWTGFTGLVSFALSLYLWDFITGLLARNVVMGRIALVFLVFMVIAALIYILREIGSIFRLRHVASLREKASVAHLSGALKSAQDFTKDLTGFYRRKPELDDASKRVRAASREMLDGRELVDFAESIYMPTLDNRAVAEIELAVRRVSVATAIVPLAFADVFVALTTNIRMIRGIAEVYGGRPGVMGAWRLFRAVAAHIIATGAVAVGDDMIGSILGGNALAKVSRRFGEGVINGALTARVGIATMEICRPMAFEVQKPPAIRNLLKGAIPGFATETTEK